MIKNKSPATNSNQCLGRYADKLLMISKMQKMVYPQKGFTGLDMKRIHGGTIACENENGFIRNRWEVRSSCTGSTQLSRGA